LEEVQLLKQCITFLVLHDSVKFQSKLKVTGYITNLSHFITCSSVKLYPYILHYVLTFIDFYYRFPPKFVEIG